MQAYSGRKRGRDNFQDVINDNRANYYNTKKKKLQFQQKLNEIFLNVKLDEKVLSNLQQLFIEFLSTSGINDIKNEEEDGEMISEIKDICLRLLISLNQSPHMSKIVIKWCYSLLKIYNKQKNLLRSSDIQKLIRH